MKKLRNDRKQIDINLEENVKRKYKSSKKSQGDYREENLRESKLTT